MLKSVIHNWNDERAGVILQRCAQAMASGGKLILVERIVPQRLESSAAHRTIALMDLNMLVMLGARERTEDEYRALLSSAGLRLTRIIPAEFQHHRIRRFVMFLTSATAAASHSWQIELRRGTPEIDEARRRKSRRTRAIADLWV